ncbi:gamma carbonic anhydrase family protein [Rhabdothermincola salaria]|uniref:gamma carbonic anhydrase family protein n=1 Tax=Rhabdothermincola salaria TaxID=2903142 RepID=UPI001E58EE9C|nr:transferase hexapeptide repeat family protein [Rhabdothermincola salaria]
MPAYEIEGVRPVVHPGAFVHPDAVLIGDVHVGEGAYVGPLASLRGDFGRIVVGEGANVQDGCVLHCFPGEACELAPEAHVGHGAILHGCTVGSFAMIGMNAVVMDGARIGGEALVGANAFVPAGMEVPARHLAAGNPAKVVRELDDTALGWKANGVRVYQELARRSRGSLLRCEPLAEIEPDRPSLSTGTEVSVPLHVARERAEDEGSSS